MWKTEYQSDTSMMKRNDYHKLEWKEKELWNGKVIEKLERWQWFDPWKIYKICYWCVKYGERKTPGGGGLWLDLELVTWTRMNQEYTREHLDPVWPSRGVWSYTAGSELIKAHKCRVCRVKNDLSMVRQWWCTWEKLNCWIEGVGAEEQRTALSFRMTAFHFGKLAFKKKLSKHSSALESALSLSQSIHFN